MKTGLAKNVLGIKSYEVKDRDVINKSKLYTGDIWFKMHKMGLQIACVHHILKTERILKFYRTGDVSFIYRKEIDKACFQHDMP